MTGAEVVAFLSGLVDVAKHAPELVQAVKGVIIALEEGSDPTPAVKHAEAVAVARELGIPYS